MNSKQNSFGLTDFAKLEERKRFHVLWLSCILLIQAVVLGWGAWRHSPTYDELAHLPAGLSHHRFGEFELYRVNPPLVRMVAAIPAMFVVCETDWERYEKRDRSSKKRLDFLVGSDFVNANGKDAFLLYTLARWACIPFVLLGGVVIWLWGRDLYGYRAAWAAFIAWVSAPLVLGHGQLITPDVPAASIGVFAFYMFWKWLRKCTWKAVLFAGLALGLAELTKTSWLVALPIMIGLSLIQYIKFGGMPLKKSKLLAQVPCLFFIAWVVLLAGYQFDGTFKRLGDYQFSSRSLSGMSEMGKIGNRFEGTFLENVCLLYTSDAADE